jgi:N-acetylglucosaminyl-diphospho-decaprenol L-rhamnosyltransferase
MGPEVTPEVSVVIVSWNSGDDLLACLRSLEANPPSVAWEAIVVDNGSSDGSIARVREELPWARVIANRRNRGLAAANNQGLLASRAPVAVISNPDVLYGPGSVDALLDLLGRRERAAFAVARLRDLDGAVQTSAGDLPSIAEALLGQRASRARGGHDQGMWWHGWSHDVERPIGRGAEACYAVRRQSVAEFGLQDERFVLDWEGVEWSARAREAGWEVWFCPRAVVTHAGGTSLGQAQSRWIVSTHLGMYRYFAPRISPGARPVLALAVLIRALAKLGAVTAGARLYDRAHRARA